jgi:hypothetical protein
MSEWDKILKEDQVYQHLKIRQEGLSTIQASLQKTIDQVDGQRKDRYEALWRLFEREWKQKNPLGGEAPE